MNEQKKIRKEYFINIPIPLYRVHVIVSWETTKNQIMAYAKKHEVEITNEKWGRDWDNCYYKAQGICIMLGDDNTDILVWLKERPKKCSQYGILYHELHHATGRITDDHNLGGETEAQAYIYEYLATKCNEYFWPISKRQ